MKREKNFPGREWRRRKPLTQTIDDDYLDLMSFSSSSSLSPVQVACLIGRVPAGTARDKDSNAETQRGAVTPRDALVPLPARRAIPVR